MDFPQQVGINFQLPSMLQQNSTFTSSIVISFFQHCVSETGRFHHQVGGVFPWTELVLIPLSKATTHYLHKSQFAH
jgi:hypothetical protein